MSAPLHLPAEGERLTIEPMRARLRALGYVEVQTMGGPLPLDNWNPYGIAPGGANHRKDSKVVWHGRIDGDRVVDAPADHNPGSPFYLGSWPLLRASEGSADA